MKSDIKQYSRRINYLITETDAVYHEIARRLGVSDSTMLILYVLTDAGGSCPLSAIYGQTGLSKQTINSALRKLEADGTVYLCPADKKSKIVCLTDAGRTLAARTAGQVLEMENAIYTAWPQDELEAYLALTEKYVRCLRQKLDSLPSDT